MTKDIVLVRRVLNYNYGGVHHVYPKTEYKRIPQKVKGVEEKDCFYNYYQMQRSLRYVNDEHYEWASEEDKERYNAWYDALPEGTKFQMYYGNGVVD